MIPPELHIIGLVVALLVMAYGFIYPRMEEKTIERMMVIDLALGVAALMIAGSVYYGSGYGFSLLVMDVPWWVFTIVLNGLLEAPVFLWFCKKHDIDIGGSDDH